MRLSVFLLLGVFTLINCSLVRYDGYRVVRIKGDAPKLKSALDIAEQYLLDVWGSNAVEGWIDVMIPPKFSPSIFSKFDVTSRLDNVQESLEASEKQRNATRTALDFFSDFQPYSRIASWLAEQASNSGGKATVTSIGKTYLGKDIFALQLGKDESSKPYFVIQCGIHAREWIATSTCCWIINQLLTTDINLLDSFVFLVVPSLNVDGYEYTHNTDRLWRKNRQPNSGSTCVGTDLNRNYGFAWSLPGGSSNPCSETYYGSSAFSGPETTAIRNVIESISSNGEVISFFDIHSYSGLWMSPWGYTCNEVPSDYPAMRDVMLKATTALRGVNGRTYQYGPTCSTIYQTSGGSRDFTYGSGGIVHSYGVEAFGTSFTPPTSWIPPIGSEIWAGVRETAISLIGEK